MGSHRADVRTPRGLAIEFQNSPLDPGQIVERERFYGRLLWVLNAKLFLKHFHLRPGGKWEIDDDEYTGTYYTFRWRWPRKSVWFMRKPVYFDLGDGRLFRLRTVHPNVPCGGWGVMGTTRQFVNRIIESAIGDRGGANG